MAEPPTGPELEVMQLLAGSGASQRIARDPAVAVGTVKSTGRTSWASSAPPTGPMPPRGARELGPIP